MWILVESPTTKVHSEPGKTLRGGIIFSLVYSSAPLLMKEQARLPQNREQDLGGLKGLSLEGTPIRRGSLEAFCRQKFLRSAAAWDTCRARRVYVCVKGVVFENTVFVMPVANLCTTHSFT